MGVHSNTAVKHAEDCLNKKAGILGEKREIVIVSVAQDGLNVPANPILNSNSKRLGIWQHLRFRTRHQKIEKTLGI